MPETMPLSVGVTGEPEGLPPPLEGDTRHREAGAERARVSPIALLADPHNRRMVRELDAADGSVSSAKLWRLLEELPESKRRARVRCLRCVGVLQPVRDRDPRRARAWEFGPPGADLAHIARIAERLIVRLPGIAQLKGRARERAIDDVLSWLADVRTLRIATALASGAARPVDVERRLGLSHDALYKRLVLFRDNGVVHHSELGRMPRAVADELERPWRSLALPVLLALRWELRWTHPRNPALVGVAELIDVIAPLAEPFARAEGVYELIEPHSAAARPRFWVQIAKGVLRVSQEQPAAKPRATLLGTPRQWCETLTTRAVDLQITPIDGIPARELIRILRRALFGSLGLSGRGTEADRAGRRPGGPGAHSR